MKPTRWAGYDPDTRARMAAADSNLAGIITGRRRAARALLATDRRPAQQVTDDFAALTHGDVPTAKTGLPTWVVIGYGSGFGNIAFTGSGTPSLQNVPAARLGDLYLDEETGELYRLATT